MTNIMMTHKGNSHTVTAQGHATGSRDVCTSITIMFFALAQYITGHAEHTQNAPTIRLEDGNSMVSCAGDDCIRAAFDMMAGAFKLMQERDSEFIEFKEKNI